VSAQKWAIFDYYSGKYLRGYRAHALHELSGFSKLLVFCTINTLAQKDKLDLTRFQTIVTASVLKYYCDCKLQVDDIITLEDLVHLLLMEDNEEYELIAAINLGAYL
jgi:D-alanyl-D-alanine carboxypeptidase